MILLSKKFEVKFHWLVTIVVYGLKIIGLAPFSYQIWKSNEKSSHCTVAARGFRFSRIGLAYNILFIFLFLVITKSGLEDLMPLLESGDTLDWIRFSFPQLANSLTANIILISSTFRQHKAVSVMNRLVEVDRLLTGIESKPSSSKRMCIVFLLHLIFSSTLWASDILPIVLVINRNNVLWLMWDETNVFIIYWFAVEYSMVVGLLFREFQRVNNNLLNFGSFPKHQFRQQFPANYLAVVSSSSIHSQLDPTKLLLEIRTTLYEASRDVSEFFSFPILFLIACLFYKFIENIFSVLISATAAAKIQYFETLSSLLIDIYPVVLLSLNVTKAAKEAKLTRRIVHKLTSATTKDEIRTELQDFTLQLLHEDVVYTAYGFFTLNCAMLHSMVDATTTYIVFLMQNMSLND